VRTRPGWDERDMERALPLPQVSHDAEPTAVDSGGGSRGKRGSV
jgi:hypothetical protein